MFSVLIIGSEYFPSSRSSANPFFASYYISWGKIEKSKAARKEEWNLKNWHKLTSAEAKF